MKTLKALNPNFIHIGLVRYADHFHPTNEESEQRFHEFEEKIHCDFEGKVPRANRIMIARLAMENGYQLHFFEKGLGR